MRRTCILCLTCVLVSCFCACRGTSATKQIPSEDSTDVARVDNPRFFEVMKPYLSEGYTVKMVPSGISMLPVIHDREDVVLLKETKEVVPGDIVLAEIEKDHYFRASELNIPIHYCPNKISTIRFNSLIINNLQWKNFNSI